MWNRRTDFIIQLKVLKASQNGTQSVQNIQKSEQKRKRRRLHSHRPLKPEKRVQAFNASGNYQINFRKENSSMNWCWNKAFRWPEHAGSWKSTPPSPRSECNRKGRGDCRGKSKSKRNLSTPKSTAAPLSPSIPQRPVSILSSFSGHPYSRSWCLASGTIQSDLHLIWYFA